MRAPSIITPITSPRAAASPTLIARAGDGGADLLGHQAAGAFVFGVAGRAVLRHHHAGDSFDVGADEDLHGVLAMPRPVATAPM